MPDGSQPQGPAAAGVMTLPNVITILRLCLVPLAVWLVLHQDFTGAFWLFVAAGVSDGVDGWLARHNGGTSALGALLDPIADKVLLVTMYVLLAAVGVLPDWLAILVVFRDLVIVGGVLLLALLGQPAAIRPLAVSKLNTVLQILLVGTALLLRASGWVAPMVLDVLVWMAAATTFVSGAAYVWKGAQSR